ncbi:MAG: ATP-dependent DNA helicase PcrA [Candidatus Moranbacteria bacterium]|nr:ATP-dependent DNA helicase PcrA [Candidatus Moranbacteria bacterium]
MQNKILENLNEPQRRAVEHKGGPALVIAGAGSGKTRVLTYRVAYLINEGTRPENILAITFTNKAAREMMERIGKLLEINMFGGKQWKLAPSFTKGGIPTVGTFHSIGARILRDQAEKVGRKRSFAIFDEEDQSKLIQQVMRDLEVSEEQFPPFKIRDFISRMKNEMVDKKEFLKNPESYFEEIAGKVYQAYQEALKEQNAFDFDDLITVPVQLFKGHQEIKRAYQDQFRHVLVDEYQDTNRAQYDFINILGEKHRNIFVVGDDFQGIYGWRGADIHNILSFEEDYPEARVILLEQNYRSTQNILNAAHEVIAKNPRQKKKKLWTRNPAGEKITLFTAESEEDEANFIVGEIESLVAQNPESKLGETAILYRTNAQSRALEETLVRAGIPYHLVGAMRFYARKEIKDILAYFRLLVNPLDETSLRRIYNTPRRGIGKESLRAMKKVALRERKRIGEIILDPEFAKKILAENPALLKWKKLIEELAAIKNFSKRNSLSQTLEEMLGVTGYANYVLEDDVLGEERLENIKELSTVMKKYDQEGVTIKTLTKFLEEISLMAGEDRDPQDLKNRVHLMTLHAAKGLEFKRVFIAGMEEGIFPHNRSTVNPAEMEEERRLCYVGITRAKQSLFLTHAKTRRIFGNLQVNSLSRFVRDIPEELTEKMENGKLKMENEIGDEIRLSVTISDGKTGVSKSKSVDWKDGDTVFHVAFGKGVVVSQEENVVTVAFAGAGVKKLDKSIAPIKKLSERKLKKPLV